MDAYPHTAISDVLTEWIKIAALSIELLAVLIIMVVALSSTILFLHGLGRGEDRQAIYERYKLLLGRGLLLGLEMLVAADVILTVAIEPSLDSVIFLGLLVLIRTFLSWSIVIEIEHRWPWQSPKQHPPETH